MLHTLNKHLFDVSNIELTSLIQCKVDIFMSIGCHYETHVKRMSTIHAL